jgi:uncharacterized protein YkwD
MISFFPEWAQYRSGLFYFRPKNWTRGGKSAIIDIELAEIRQIQRVLARLFYCMSTKTNKKLILSSYIVIASLVFLSQANLVYASEIAVSKVIELANQARGQEGLVTLSESKTLDKIAQDKLDDMIKNNYFAHNSPKGATPWSWYEKENYDYKYAGENLAISFLTAEGQQKAWMDSPTHRKNIMNPLFQEIGVAVAAGEINNQMAIISVQEFGTLAGAGAVSGKPGNFNGTEKKDVLKENQKIVPTVLSVKDTNSQDYLNIGKGNNDNISKNYFSKLGDWASGNKLVIYNFLNAISMIALMSSLILMPAIFVAEAAKKISLTMVSENITLADLERMSEEEYEKIMDKILRRKRKPMGI